MGRKERMGSEVLVFYVSSRLEPSSGRAQFVYQQRVCEDLDLIMM